MSDGAEFSLRKPTTSQERSGKKKRRLAAFEMTGVGLAARSAAMRTGLDDEMHGFGTGFYCGGDEAAVESGQFAVVGVSQSQ